MSERISRKALEYRILWLNQALGRPIVPWKQVDGRNVSAIGNFHLDKCLGGWQVNEMDNLSGGVRCPFGHRRMNSRQLCDMLDAVLAAVEMGKQHAAKERLAA